MTLSEDTVRLLVCATVLMFGIQALTFYAITKLLVTGSGIFVRRQLEEQDPPQRISLAGR